MRARRGSAAITPSWWRHAIAVACGFLSVACAHGTINLYARKLGFNAEQRRAIEEASHSLQLRLAAVARELNEGEFARAGRLEPSCRFAG